MVFLERALWTLDINKTVRKTLKEELDILKEHCPNLWRSRNDYKN